MADEEEKEKKMNICAMQRIAHLNGDFISAHINKYAIITSVLCEKAYRIFTVIHRTANVHTRRIQLIRMPLKMDAEVFCSQLAHSWLSSTRVPNREIQCCFL